MQDQHAHAHCVLYGVTDDVDDEYDSVKPAP